MNGFRLIAIRPLQNCHKDFLKVLKENEIYKFYDDYMFLNKNGTIVVKDELVHEIVYNSTVPEELYNINQVGRNPIHVNISAIVGKNGSGKSSLIELLFLAVYVIGIKKEYLIGSKYFLSQIKKLEIECDEKLRTLNENQEQDNDNNRIKITEF